MARIKALFIGMDGVIHGENIPKNKREIEFIDGAHPITPPSIYHDVDGVGPPLYIVWHGRPMPEGADLDSDQEKAIIKEAVHMRQHTFRPLVSKRWIRLTLHGFVILLKSIMIGFVLAVILRFVFVVIT
jgi:hypothetical protein